jgi:hypothetical protein
MLALPLFVAALATAQPTTAYPEGLLAHCTGGQTAWMGLNAEYLPTKPSQAAGGSGTIEILYTGGHFVVRLYGHDFIDSIENGARDWKLEVLRQAPGDLVLLLQSAGYTFLHVAVYHLQFKGVTGGLLVTTTSYGGPPDFSSVASLSCSIRRNEGK